MKRTPNSVRLALAAVILIASVFAVTLFAGTKDVVNSPHNLSVSGTGAVKSGEQQVCIFCHAPHNVNPNLKPLWNHQMSAATYNVYGSTTMTGKPAQPNQVSKLCLSCHDGTVASGQTIGNGLITTTGTMGTSKNLGTDLKNDHPISFPVVNDGQLNPALLSGTTGDPAVKLKGGTVECTTCHEPHQQNIDPVALRFLVRTNSNSSICLACHDVSQAAPNVLNGWNTAAHKTASNSVPATAGLGPYSTVSANGCESCHANHNAASVATNRLLRAADEKACSPCHSSTTTVSPAPPNIMTEFGKKYAHPINATGHDAAESAYPLNTSRHAKCMDCHNSHAASNTGGSIAPPGVKSPELGASGVDATTGASALLPAKNEYEICFKCHGNSTNKPQNSTYTAYGHTAVRAVAGSAYNVRLDLQATNISKHNVTQPRSTAGTPSLRANIINLDGSTGRSLAAGTYLYCSDCHNNDSARNGGRTGPNGPHGSVNTHLLERRYDQEGAGGTWAGFVAGTAGSAALCYKCHDVDGVIRTNQTFSRHTLHISRTGCSTCHAAHGNQSTSVNNKRLLNFDTTIVSGVNGAAPYVDTTNKRCYLSCHGETHNGYSYQ